MGYRSVGTMALMAILLWGLAFVGGTSQATESAATDLFISEYVEGSSNNKALEIYNGTASAVDLTASGYVIDIYFNGATSPGNSVSLVGTLAVNDVIVVADNDAAAAILAVADILSEGNFFNGDDVVILRNNDGIVDVIGQWATDPGAEWGSGDISTQNNTIRRQETICAGDTNENDAFDPATEWTGFASDTVDGLGSHTANCGVVVTCGPAATMIHEIQGSGLQSGMIGQSVTIEGVVTADYQDVTDELGGFYIQEEDEDVDGEAATSEGIFVFDSGFGVEVSVGDVVQLSGQVAEFETSASSGAFLTQIRDLTAVTICDSGKSVTPTTLTLPVTNLEDWEAFEGMLISIPQELTVTNNFDLGRFGSVDLAVNQLLQPTQVVAPGQAALDYQDLNNRSRIILDDANTNQNIEPTLYPNGGLSASNTLRTGYTVDGITAILEQRFSAYRLQPTGPISFTASSNPRTAPPATVTGTVKVASYNVLNFFNGDGVGGGFPTPRGATNQNEYERQLNKIVAAITEMDADIVGLVEIENDGYGTTSALSQLVDAINAAAGTGTYAFVTPQVSQIGTDAIAVALIYKPATMSLAGSAQILDSSVDPTYDDARNRPALAQTFVEIASGESLTVAVNHFKSKGSACDSSGDPDTGDGQGNCNLTRTAAATAEVNWLATDPTGSGDPDFLILGDLNAYAMEDPIVAIENAGYTDLIERYFGSDTYSFQFFGQFGYLDYALANASLNEQVVGVTEWHINADEPRVLDYNEEFKSLTQIESFYNADSYRSSDHDPVIVELILGNRIPLYLPMVGLQAP